MLTLPQRRYLCNGNSYDLDHWDLYAETFMKKYLRAFVQHAANDQLIRSKSFKKRRYA